MCARRRRKRIFRKKYRAALMLAEHASRIPHANRRPDRTIIIPAKRKCLPGNDIPPRPSPRCRAEKLPKNRRTAAAA
ncbi:Hypothetical protein NTJ_04663 [Nesidiocoris tenuis]|uniref:Uncharacterized protein n=1 Tax=Nesidiocoris tenuis TaxID=355587 RepID=A0ABN7AHY7_9HEMI|nr:Hypothetical protein NTJ_04663 [Nesidiocoris tenuis]